MILNSFALVGLIVSALGLAAGLAIGLLGKRIRETRVTNESKERDLQDEVRLNLVRRIHVQENERYKAFKQASMLLGFSQFVVGGVLASAFVIKTLGETIVGLLGVVVLLSTLVSRQLRPNLLAKVTLEKLRRLRTLRRRLEDELYVLTRTSYTDQDLVRIRLSATKELELIESSELKTLEQEATNL